MDRTRLLHIGRYSFWLSAQLFVFILCSTFISFVYKNNILPDKHVKETFVQAGCTIMNKTLSTKGKFFHRYRSDFAVAYTTAQGRYQTFASGNGLDRSFTTNQQSQVDAINQFEVGAEYPCWYNPSAPHVVVLVMRHSWTSTFPLIVPTVIILITLYYFFQTMFQLIGLFTLKAREVVKKRGSHKNK